jgi:hypothetical protein
LEQQQQQANNQGCIHNQASPVIIVFPLSCDRTEENIFSLANYIQQTVFSTLDDFCERSTAKTSPEIAHATSA